MAINTAKDAIVSGVSADYILKMATKRVTYDDARYPRNYNVKLKPGESGYVVPLLRYEYEIDQNILKKFGIELED